MNFTPLEQSLIDAARAHQGALATYYPRHRDGQSDGDAHAEYLKHTGALTELVSLAYRESGMSPLACVELREIEAQDIATFKHHFPVKPASAESVSQASTPVLLSESQ